MHTSLTKFTLETLFLANLVYPDQRCLTNVIQDSVEDFWARDTIEDLSVIGHTYWLCPCNAPLDVIVLIGRDVDVLSGHGRKSEGRKGSKTNNGIVGKFWLVLNVRERRCLTTTATIDPYHATIIVPSVTLIHVCVCVCKTPVVIRLKSISK